MDGYKRILKSQALRMRILKSLEWIPDSVMVKVQYYIKMKRHLPLNNPQRYTEKIQWYKVYYHNPIMTTCVDKYLVHDYVRQLGLENILIPLLGVWDNANDIDWNLLPEQFILKTTNGSETNIFVKNKNEGARTEMINQLNNWLTQTNINAGREWAYDGVKPRIICEPIIDGNDQHGVGLDDYKFFCFNGKVRMMWIDFDRFENHKRVLYLPNGDKLDVRCTYSNECDFEYPREIFDEMIPVVEKLAKGFPHSRIDLYYVEGKIYFGEITFYSGSGYEPFDDDSFDIELGDFFDLPDKWM